MSTPLSSTSDLKPLNPSSSNPTNDNKKRSLGEKILSTIFDRPSGTQSSKLSQQLREKWEEDKLDDLPRTEKEERERQERIKKRSEIVGGGDGVRTNDMQKEGWGGAILVVVMLEWDLGLRDWME